MSMGRCGKERHPSRRCREPRASRGTPMLAIIAVGLSLALQSGEVFAESPPLTPKQVVIAFDSALARDDMATARSLAVGTDAELAAAKYRRNRARIIFHQEFVQGKAFPAQHSGVVDYDTEMACAGEDIDGNEATVQTGRLIIPTFYLTKVDGMWKVSVRGAVSPKPSEIAADQRRLPRLTEIADKIEKGFYNSDEEVEKEKRAFDKAEEEAKQAARTPPLSEEAKAIRAALTTTSQPIRSGSKTSLAIERYLRSRYLGGGTEPQLIAVSDAMAAKLDAASLSEQLKASFFHEKDGGVELDLAELGRYAHDSSYSKACEKVRAELDDCMPPRMLFDDMWSHPQPRHVDQPLPSDSHAAVPPHFEKDQLASEHLEKLEKAIYKLAVTSVDNRRSSSGYWDEVQEFASNYVVTCRYRGSDPGSRSRPYFFWYDHVPEGVIEALKTLPADHPIRQIGPPLSSGPADLASARTLCEGVADAEKRWAVIKRERGDIPGTKREWTREEREAAWTKDLIGIMRALAEADAANLADSKKVVAASGGTKMLCPRCGGAKKIVQHNHNSDVNPHDPGTLGNSLYDMRRDTTDVVTCDLCDGTGVIDAK